MMYIILYILIGMVISAIIIKNSEDRDDGLWGLIWPIPLLVVLLYFLFVMIPGFLVEKLGRR